MRPMSTTTFGRASRSFIAGIRLWPPASTFASSPYRLRSATASSTVDGRVYSKFEGYISDSCHGALHRYCCMCLDGSPDALRRQRQIQMSDADRIERVEHRVGERGRRADCAGFPDALDAERIHR